MTEDDKRFVIETLRNAGIKMRVGGCGCCQSPQLFFEFNGRQVSSEFDETDLGKPQHTGYGEFDTTLNVQERE